jgi:hypothetical protein
MEKKGNVNNDGKETYSYLMDVAVSLSSSVQSTDAGKMNKDVNSAHENKGGDWKGRLIKF